ncbi:9060_t:CDS:2 [Rhizophagus irregularis]|nr:9060_t:CDS:2 [Rhizophagus irregularis]
MMVHNKNNIVSKRRRRRSLKAQYDRSHLSFVASMRQLPLQNAQGTFATQLFGVFLGDRIIVQMMKSYFLVHDSRRLIQRNRRRQFRNIRLSPHIDTLRRIRQMAPQNSQDEFVIQLFCGSSFY